MMIDPNALGGLDRFKQEASWTAAACLGADPLDSTQPVRLPGQAALSRKREYREKGVVLDPGILPALEKWSTKLGVLIPNPIAGK